MGLTNEQKKERVNDSNVKYIVNNLCDKDKDKDYIFISYKSDDWKEVLQDVVYRLVKNEGLNVYFDGSFDIHNSLWIEQFPKNMNDPKCKGVLAFIDDKYATSYATLLELMYSQLGCYNEEYDPVKKPVVPVNLEILKAIEDKSDTGLGQKKFADGTVNPHADSEYEMFKNTYNSPDSNQIFRLIKNPIENEVIKEKKLNKVLCSKMVQELLKYVKANDNPYSYGADLSGIVGSIKDACGETVFSRKTKETYVVKFINEGNIIKTLSVVNGGLIIAPEVVAEGKNLEGWCYESANGENVWQFDKDTVNQNLTLIAKWKSSLALEPDSTDRYEYSLLGNQYVAEKREQGKIMYDVFETLTKSYPEKIEDLTRLACIARAENVILAGTKNAKPPYFRGCRGFEIAGIKYYVGTSYGYVAKLQEVKKMIEICGLDIASFVLNNQSLDKILNVKNHKGKKCKNDDEGNSKDEQSFEYTLWGEKHTADKLSDMMHDVFELIVGKYPQKVNEFAKSDGITSVALKTDVEQNKLPVNKLNYFKAKKEHTVGGVTYYVGTRYNREQGIGQLKKMLELCEGNSSSFLIEFAPEKKKKNNGNKRGIDELLD